MDAFAQAFQRTVGLEGRYVHDPRDSGGETMYGITAAVARDHGYVGALISMPLGVAQAIYRAGYWNLLRLDDVAAAADVLALELFDCAVNCGQATAGKYLQRALNAFNRNGTDYPDVDVDGLIGPRTIAGARRLLAVRGDDGQTVLLRAINCLRGAGYITDVEARPKDERYAFGWFLNRIS